MTFAGFESPFSKKGQRRIPTTPEPERGDSGPQRPPGIIVEEDPFRCYCGRYSLLVRHSTLTAMTPGEPDSLHSFDGCRKA